MEKKFTPGKWWVSGDGTQVLCNNQQGFYATEVLADCKIADKTFGITTHHFSDETIKANARLISASPEMLALLEQINCASKAPLSKKEWVQIIEQIEPLLIKARGITEESEGVRCPVSE